MSQSSPKLPSKAPTSVQLRTSQIPPQFLNSLFLLGKVPWRASVSDPRVSYALYIPEEPYLQALENEKSPSGSKTSTKLPLLVNIHGSRRNLAPVHSEAMMKFAHSQRCAVLAPSFPAGLDGPEDMDSYKVLRSRTLAADKALLGILDEVGSRWDAINVEKIYLMGFSGGGQFVHRFMYLYPERLRAASVGAPGRVTWLDSGKAWPEGIADAKALFDKEIDVPRLKDISIQLIIGEDDDTVHGGVEFWNWVSEIKAKQGVASKRELKRMEEGRLTIARKLLKHWQDHGIEAQLVVVPHVKHVAEDVQEHVLSFIEAQMNTNTVE